MSWKAYLDSQPWHGVSKLMILKDGGPNTSLFVQKITFRELQSGLMIGDDDVAFTFTRGEEQEFFRALVDLAWEQGIKPTAMESFSGELKAQSYHLEDMRKLVLEDRA